MASNSMYFCKMFRNIILWRLVLAAAVSGMAPWLALAEEEIAAQPQREYVVADRTPVRADASERHDPSMFLTSGTAVEVFLRKANGWCAIRPPAGSFSWVPARYVSHNTGTGYDIINHDDPASWIGTDQTDRRLTWQVRLQKGERVRVLGTKTVVPDSSGVVQTWCKILPPSGEFRWIHESHLSSTVPEKLTVPVIAVAVHPEPIKPQPQEPARLPSVLDARHIGAVGTGVRPEARLEPMTPEIQTAGHTEPIVAPPVDTEQGFDVKQTQWRARTPGNSRITGPGVTRPRESAFAPKDQPSGVIEDTAGNGATATTVPPAFRGQLTTDTTGVTGDMASQRRLVELELSRIAALTPDLWHFDKVRARAENLVRTGKTMADREGGRAILGEIGQFESLRQRRDQLALARLRGSAPRVATGPAPTPLVPTPPAVASTPPRPRLAAAAPRARHDNLFSWVPRGIIGTQNQQPTAEGETSPLAPLVELGTETSPPTATPDVPTPTPAPAATPTLAPPVATPALTTPEATPDTAADSPYNGVGRLMPVVFSPTDPQANPRQREPLYALMSPSGKILHLVSPAPGMNLSSYKGRHVGIIGRDGPTNPWKTPHLVADRIITLKDKRY